MRESNEFATQKGDLKPGDSNIETSETGGLRLNIRVRLAVILLISGLIPLGALTYSLNQKIKAELLDINKNQLVALREEKKLQIESYFKQIESQIITFSNDHMIVNAMKEFKKAFFKVEKETGEEYSFHKENLMDTLYIDLRNSGDFETSLVLYDHFKKSFLGKVPVFAPFISIIFP